MPGVVVTNQIDVALKDDAGIAMAVQDSTSIPVNTSAILVAGQDDLTNSKFLRVDLDGTISRTKNVISSGNSTSLPLGVGNVFTGIWEEVLGYAEVGILLTTDQASETNGLELQHSINGIDIDNSDTYTITAGAQRYLSVPPEAQYFRLKYTNGAIAQVYFRLQVIFHPYRAKPSSHNLSQSLTDDNDAELVKAIISGRKEDGTYANAVFDDQGRLIVSPTLSATDKGFVDGDVVLAATAVAAIRDTVYTEQTSNAQRSIVSASANDASASTGARTVKITYYKSDMTGPFSETITMNGTTPVNTVATDICFIQELMVVTVGSTGSNVGIISLKAATAGGGATIWSIAATRNKTFGCHHYVATGQIANITGLSLGIKGADTTSGFLRKRDPTTVTSAEIQISDNLRTPSSGQTFRPYGTPIEVVGPAFIIGYALPDSSSSRTYYMSFDFYEE